MYVHAQCMSDLSITPPRQSLVDRLHQRAFGLIAGRNLLYNTCWEDPAVDRQALQLAEGHRVLVIASAGCNALDYALCAPREVVAVDVNPRQIALLELKMAAIRHLRHDEAFELFGRGGSSRVRDYYEAMRRDLSPFAQRWWDRRWTWFDGRRSFYWRGLSGLAARLVRSWIDRDPGLSMAIEQILRVRTLAEQRRCYDEEVVPRMWTPQLEKRIGHRAFLTLLGVPAAQRREIAESHPGGIAGFIRKSVDVVFRDHLLATNYFWRVYLTGNYDHDCCPAYLSHDGFQALKDGLVDRVTPKVATVSDLLADETGVFDRFVLLDHLDWMGWYHPQALNEEWAQVLRTAGDGARVLFRSASVVPEWLTQVRVNGQRLNQRLQFSTALAQDLHQLDRVGTYASFHIANVSVA
jgi:S-adenosylmethionine-diacylglycerol 3-amino-3-carboxypropyl transferase